MASKEDIVGQFVSFNIKPSTEVITKCLEMCLNHNVNAEELVDQWLAYTCSNLRGAAPTVEYLEKMERTKFPKPKIKEQVSKNAAVAQSTHVPLTSLPTLSADMLGALLKINQAPVPKTQNKKKILGNVESTISSPDTPGGIYAMRTDARSVQCHHGPKDAQFKREFNVSPTVLPAHKENLKSDAQFMNDTMLIRALSINDMTERILRAIGEKYKWNYTEQIKEEIGSKSIYFGRIVYESDRKTNKRVILLELTYKHNGAMLYLNLSGVPKYSLFPGQSVTVTGRHYKPSDILKHEILVEEIYADTTFNLHPEPPVTDGSLQIVTACGPFTSPDNLLFRPLNDLLLYVKEYMPNVLLLMGPFYARDHPGIMNGQLRQTFHSFFLDLIENIMNTLKNTKVHVIIVACQNDPHVLPVYPTPPYTVRDKYENLTFIQDPAMVNVNGLIIGATSADILFHLSGLEMHRDATNSGPPDRMGRIASQLFKQQSFYPLEPPYRGVCVDMGLMKTYGIMKIKPHILVLPSNLKHFVKEIDDCVIINPERLVKGNVGGTFARIEIRSGVTATVCGRSVCQILKI